MPATTTPSRRFFRKAPAFAAFAVKPLRHAQRRFSAPIRVRWRIAR
jgi:hypothetical protein